MFIRRSITGFLALLSAAAVVLLVSRSAPPVQAGEFEDAVAMADQAILDARRKMDEARNLGFDAQLNAILARGEAATALAAAERCDSENFLKHEAEYRRRTQPPGALEKALDALKEARVLAAVADTQLVTMSVLFNPGSETEQAEIKRLRGDLAFEVDNNLKRAEENYAEALRIAEEAAATMTKARALFEQCRLALSTDKPRYAPREAMRVCFDVAADGQVSFRITSRDTTTVTLYVDRPAEPGGSCADLSAPSSPGSYCLEIEFTSAVGTSKKQVCFEVAPLIDASSLGGVLLEPGTPLATPLFPPPSQPTAPGQIPGGARPDAPPTGGAGCAPGSGEPRVSPNATTGPPGRPVTVTGSGFAPNSPVTLTFANDRGGTAPGGTATTNAAGSFTTTIAVPAVTPGPHVVRAVDCAGRQATAPFTITGGG